MERRPRSDRVRLKELFQAALESPAAERERLLEEASHAEGTLAAEARSLLAAHEREGGFLEVLVAEEGRALSASRSAPIPKRIGAYEVLAPLGSGGMGAVYVGRRADEAYEARVAIKLIRAGLLSEEVLRRFRAERQTLATLNHPGIARLLDGGTTPDGIPYLVMEYVEGMPITDYCDSHGLGIERRLRLVRSVCEAVEHAHRNLIVHRDLKPANILVTESGEVKLLDFGIAKLLTGQGERALELTRTGERVLTPDYASPEQIRGEPIATASDVYSLGVLLYRLLTGRHPYRFTSDRASEVERVVCEEAPVKPSAAVTLVEAGHGAAGPPKRLRQRLRGDLDNIVLKALRKEPERRYGSAEQLSEDIRRYLDGFPVIARRDTAGYRAEKFLRRHRLGFTAAAFVMLALLSLLAAALWQARLAEKHARRAGAERTRAEERFGDVRKLANSFLFEFHDAIEHLPGSTPAREIVVRRALEYLDLLSRESAGDDPSLRRELAMAYLKVGNVQGNPNNANLGQTANALESYRKGLAIAESLAEAHPGDPQTRRSVAVISEKMADVLAVSGDVASAVASSRKSLGIFQALAAEAPGDAKAERSVAISHIKAGDLAGNPSFVNAGRPEEALEHYTASLTVLETLARRDPSDVATRRFLGLVFERIGTQEMALGRPAKALEAYRRSLHIRQPLAAEQHDNTDARRDAAISYEKIGDVLRASGDRRGALRHYEKSLEVFEALSRADPENANASRSLSIGYEKIAGTVAERGEAGKASIFFEKSRVIRERLAAADPGNEQARRDLEATLESLAKLPGPGPR